MKKQKQSQPTKSKVRVLEQVCKLIPPHLVPKLARATGVDAKSRTYTPWSHVVAMLYSQIAHSVGLNDVCDSLRLNSGALSAIRGATPPSHNNLSNCNKVRDSALAERLYWEMVEHVQRLDPGIMSGGKGRRVMRRFRCAIHAIDATVLPLVVSCMDWAKHRRRKAAAKCHLRLNLQSFLPKFAIVGSAGQADAKRAREVCAGLSEGEIGIFDRAYLDFEHLEDLHRRGVWWVTRAKENLSLSVHAKLPVVKGSNILKDEIVVLNNPKPGHPESMRRVTALVEVDGKEREMVFLTNNMKWSPQTVVDLYGCRWEIEVFFKEIKQTLQLTDFLGESANAVRWQVWIALLVHLLMRYLSRLSRWGHSFIRLFALIRAALWKSMDVVSLLECYGTAGKRLRMRAAPEQAYLPGFG